VRDTRYQLESRSLGSGTCQPIGDQSGGPADANPDWFHVTDRNGHSLAVRNADGDAPPDPIANSDVDDGRPGVLLP